MLPRPSCLLFKIWVSNLFVHVCLLYAESYTIQLLFCTLYPVQRYWMLIFIFVILSQKKTITLIFHFCYMFGCRKQISGTPSIEFNETEESDTALSQLQQSSAHYKSVISFWWRCEASSFTIIYGMCTWNSGFSRCELLDNFGTATYWKLELYCYNGSLQL